MQAIIQTDLTGVAGDTKTLQVTGIPAAILADILKTAEILELELQAKLSGGTN